MSNIWRKPAALFGAGMLLFALFGAALAHAGPSDQGISPVTTEGNITVEGGGGNDQVDCDAADAVFFDVGDFDSEGEASGTSDDGVTVDATYDDSTKEVSFTVDGGVVLIAYVKGSSAYNTYDYTGLGGVDEDGHLHAPANPSGDAGLSHLIFCTGEGPEATPTFFQSQEGETDAPTGTPIVTAPPTDAPTDAPSFFQSQAGETDAPSEPDTATITTGGPASPADSAWLLVVALGVLLASVVVLTPARAKSRR